MLETKKSWSQYFQPTQPISPNATKVNNLAVINYKLCRNGRECKDVVHPKTGLTMFIDQLVQNYPDGVILIAHNGAKFDFPRLKRNLDRFDVKLKTNYTIHCIDSLPLFRQNFPNLEAHNQPVLVRRFLNASKVPNEHDALVDCMNLKKIIKAAARQKKEDISAFLDHPRRPLTTFN